MYNIQDKTTLDNWNSCPSLDTAHIAQAFLILPNSLAHLSHQNISASSVSTMIH